MARRGRPTKLTPEIANQIVMAITTGNYIETAAAFAGIHKDTLYDWLKKGARAKSGPYQEFSDAVEKALAESEVRDVTLIANAAKDNWTAAAWRLERKHPERWGRRDRTEVTGKDGGPIEIADARERLAAKLSDLAARQQEREADQGPQS